MIITAEPVDLTIPESDMPRTPGLHLSSIIRAMAIQGGLLKDSEVEELGLADVRTITDRVAVIRICMGLAWEQWYLPQLKKQGVISHPGELYLDGIYMTPDAESVSYVVSQKFIGYANIIHECKLTYKSTNTVRMMAEVKKNWMWLTQLRAYCRAAGTRFGWMHVLFVCGDYLFPIQPQIWLFKIEFETHELDENWDLIIEYVEYRGN